MIKIKLRGFTLVEVIVSIAYFSVVASSIYLMSSYLVSSSKFITKDYASTDMITKNDRSTYFMNPATCPFALP